MRRTQENGHVAYVGKVLEKQIDLLWDVQEVESGRLQDVVEFKCAKCVVGELGNPEEKNELLLRGDVKLDCVDRCCYSGGIIGTGGVAGEVSRTRVRCSWGKFMEFSPISASRRVSLN